MFTTMLYAVKKSGYRLLPEDSDLGYTPYLWLFYLLFLLPGLLFLPSNTLSYALTGVSVVIFLPLYFCNFWVKTLQKRVPVCLAILVIGIGLLPFNASASVYFIYAAACGGYLTIRRWSWGLIAGSAASLVIESLVLSFPWYAIAMPATMVLLIGMANYHDSVIQQKNAVLKQTREVADRLARTAERERIGRDLHDLLGHSLSLIALKAELAGKLLQRDKASAAEEVADLERIARESLREVREAVSGYREAGLLDELAQAEQSLRAAAIEFVVEEGFKARVALLSKDVEKALAMCLREAVTNTIRHANARRFSLSVIDAEQHTEWLIRDDGIGLSITSAGVPENAGGLSGMQQRLADVNCQLVIDSEDGLALRVIVPQQTLLASDQQSQPEDTEKAMGDND